VQIKWIVAHHPIQEIQDHHPLLSQDLQQIVEEAEVEAEVEVDLQIKL